MQDPQQLVLTLKDALQPSHREWAAAALAHVDAQAVPQVVDALLMAAHDDPAPTVRSSCVRAVVKLNVHTATVVGTLEALRSDPTRAFARTRSRRLSSLTVPSGQAIQPAGGIMPK